MMEAGRHGKIFFKIFPNFYINIRFGREGNVVELKRITILCFLYLL